MLKSNVIMRKAILVLVVISLFLAINNYSSEVTPSVKFIQLTFSTGPVSEYPSLNMSGHLMGFISDGDFVTGSNPEFNMELFLMDIYTHNINQLTYTASARLMDISLDGAGKKVVFVTTWDLIPWENADSNSEVFVLNTDGSGLKQLTHSLGLGGNVLPNIDRQGRKVVFQSTDDLIPGQNTDGFNEIFMVNADGTGLRQLTSSPVPSQSACFDASGKSVIFVSSYNFTGENPDWGDELFMMNLMTNEIVQLSNVTNLYGVSVCGRPAVDSAMKKIVFGSERDPIFGGNPDGNSEIFMLDLRSRQITQLTSTVGGRGSWGTSISGDGNTIAFSSDRDLVPGSNTDGIEQIFLAVWEK